MSEPYPAELSFRAQSRVLLIGTTRCARDEAYLPPLPQVKENILRLERLLKDPDVVGLPATSVTTLLDAQEANHVTEAVAAASEAATDTLIVYYAGHGLYGDAEVPLYLAAANTTDDRKAFNAVPITLVRRAMRNSRANKRVLILDCCYSGRAFEGMMGGDGAKAAAEPSIDLEGTYGIAAAPGDARAYAPPQEALTRFTGALVDVLEGGFEGSSLVLTLDEVFSEVESRIRRLADAPLPRRVNLQNGGGFRFAYNRRRRLADIQRIEAGLESLREVLGEIQKRQRSTEAQIVVLTRQTEATKNTVLGPQQENIRHFGERLAALEQQQQRSDIGMQAVLIGPRMAYTAASALFLVSGTSLYIRETTSSFDLNKLSAVSFDTSNLVAAFFLVVLLVLLIFGERSKNGNVTILHFFHLTRASAWGCSAILLITTLQRFIKTPIW